MWTLSVALLMMYSGTDSAPHPLASKNVGSGNSPPAGVFTQPCATQLVLLALEEATEKGIISESNVTQEKLVGFFNKYGRSFYKLPDNSAGPKIILERKGQTIPDTISKGDLEVGISKAGSSIFSLSWEKV